jgi:anti-anti-sigma factor
MTISSKTPENQPKPCPVCGAAVPVESAAGANPGACGRCGYLVWFTQETTGGVQTIRPTIRLVPADALDKLIGSMNMPPAKSLVIDLSDVDLLPSACLGKLVRLNKNAEAAGGKLVLRNLSSNLVNVFQITGLDRVLNIED